MNKETQKFGLLPLPEDNRDFQLGSIFSLPKLEELPESFILKRPIIKHQKNSDFCTAFAVTSASELEEGVELSPEYQFAKTKQISGDPESWGADLRTACKSAVSYGSLEQKENPNKLNYDNREFIADYKNWDEELDSKALEHKKKTYFKTTGQYDTFDDIRASLWKFREQQQAVVLGLVWSWGLHDKFLTIDNAIGGQYGHALICIGWETFNEVPYLVVQNSYGKEAGNDGLHYISRDVINQDVGRFGSFMLVDIPRDMADYLLDNNIKVGDFWFVVMFKVIIKFIKDLWK